MYVNRTILESPDLLIELVGGRLISFLFLFFFVCPSISFSKNNNKVPAFVIINYLSLLFLNPPLTGPAMFAHGGEHRPKRKWWIYFVMPLRRSMINRRDAC